MNSTIGRVLLLASASHLPLASESVQCVVTSPPYWGLRNYAGEQRQVWGGEPEHAHDWRAAERKAGGGQTDGVRWQHTGGGPSGHPAAESTFCACGAWYGSLGLEPTPDLYIDHLVAVFRDVRRVLRSDGTLWLNLGDSYAGSWSGTYMRPDGGTQRMGVPGFQPLDDRVPARGGNVPAGRKPKDLVGIPWMVAFALQAGVFRCVACGRESLGTLLLDDHRLVCRKCGTAQYATPYDRWWNRSDIIWSKSNPMPESITDRPTKAHEYLFLLTKSGDSLYWSHRDHAGTRSAPPPDYRWQEYEWDDENSVPAAVGPERDEEPPPGWRNERIGTGRARWRRYNLWAGHDYYYDADAIREPHVDDWSARASSWRNGDAKQQQRGESYHPFGEAKPFENPPHPAGRNRRTVWTIATQPYAGAHFATFPEALVEPCVLAGSAPKACGVCGAPWARVTERTGHENIREPAHVPGNSPTKTDSTGWGPTSRSTEQWRATCAHDDDSGASLVLDPFNGSGTTGRVALRHGRSYIGIDVSLAYLAEQSTQRTTDIQHALDVSDVDRVAPIRRVGIPSARMQQPVPAAATEQLL